MMISPDAYYELNLKDKSAEQITKEIRRLKQEIKQLKKVLVDPAYSQRAWAIEPGEDVQLSCMQDYLMVAKRALAAAENASRP